MVQYILNKTKLIKDYKFYISLNFNILNHYLNGNYNYKSDFMVGGVMY